MQRDALSFTSGARVFVKCLLTLPNLTYGELTLSKYMHTYFISYLGT